LGRIAGKSHGSAPISVDSPANPRIAEVAGVATADANLAPPSLLFAIDAAPTGGVGSAEPR